MEALGLIENRSLLASVVAADTALKAANVTLIDLEIIKGGYVTVQLIGDVSAVQSAVEAAKDAVESYGTLISSHVIPRMHADTHQLIRKLDSQVGEQEPPLLLPSTEQKMLEEPKEIQAPSDTEEVAQKLDTENVRVVQNESVSEQEESSLPTLGETKLIEKTYTRRELQKMTVSKLRTLVREKKAMASNEDINYARKGDLINSLLKLYGNQ